MENKTKKPKIEKKVKKPAIAKVEKASSVKSKPVKKPTKVVAKKSVAKKIPAKVKVAEKTTKVVKSAVASKADIAKIITPKKAVVKVKKAKDEVKDKVKEEIKESAKPVVKGGVATNMDQLLAQSGIEVKHYPEGTLIEGNIVSISPNKILIDVGSKAEGMVPKDQMSDSEKSYKTLKIGDKILVMVEKEENRLGYIELSIKKAEAERKWRDFETMFKEKTPFEVTVQQYNKGGLICDAMGMQGFVPISHLDSARFAEVSSAAKGSAADIEDRLDPLMGKELKVAIIELDRSQNRLVLSEKAVFSEKNKEQRQSRLDEIKVGEKINGIVSGVVPFGLFVDLNGLEGLVHVSEIAWEKVENPANYHNVGDKITAEILDIDQQKGKVGLSIKRLKDNPWESVAEKYPEGARITGEVTKVVAFGAFIQLEPGLEGLVHISEMSGELVAGQKVEAVVTLVDSKEQRLGLSIRQIAEPQMIR